MINYIEILIRKFPNQEWTIEDDDYNKLTWFSNTTKPSQEELDNLWEEVQLEIAAEQTAKENAKQNALIKLEALNLTIEDIKSLLI